jgi:hypothetical protein
MHTAVLMFYHSCGYIKILWVGIIIIKSEVSGDDVMITAESEEFF